MSQETSNFVLGALLLIVVIPVLYMVARIISMIGDMWGAHLLAPLAAAIGGTIDWKCPCIRGIYQGRDVRVSFSPKQSVGSGESATWINAFHIEVTNLPGNKNWSIRFHPSGMLGQGPKQLYIEVNETALGKRLESSGVLDEVAGVSAPTNDYLTVEYDARRRVLTYTDDVSPRWIPSPDHFVKQLALVALLAQVNEKENPA